MLDSAKHTKFRKLLFRRERTSSKNLEEENKLSAEEQDQEETHSLIYPVSTSYQVYSG